MSSIILKRILSLISGILLMANGIYMIALKKIHVGTILPLLIGTALVLFALTYHQLQHFLQNHAILKRLWLPAWYIFFTWLISVAVFFAYIHIKTQQTSSIPAVQAIIVLGSGTENGHPTPTLASRLDVAATVAQQQPSAYIIVSGGQDFGEKYTEAEVMSRYLIQKHPITAERIYLEDKSTSTELNLKNSIPVLKKLNIHQSDSIAISTSDFHTLRAAAIATKLGYSNISMVPAPTPLHNRYNAWFREYFAYISGWLLNEY